MQKHVTRALLFLLLPQAPPQAQPSLSAQPTPTTEVQSKFRWAVDAGHYYWKGSGAAGPMMVGWGKKGATVSTPRVMGGMVTLDDGGGPGGPGGGGAGLLKEIRRRGGGMTARGEGSTEGGRVPGRQASCSSSPMV